MYGEMAIFTLAVIWLADLILLGYVLYKHLILFIEEEKPEVFKQLQPKKTWNREKLFDEGVYFAIPLIGIISVFAVMVWPAIWIIGGGLGIAYYLRHKKRMEKNNV